MINKNPLNHSDESSGSCDFIENDEEVESQLHLLRENSSSLVSVDLRYKDLSDEELKRLFDSLTTNFHVKGLFLDGNTRLMTNTKLLAEALAVNTSIQKLCIRFSDIGDEGARDIIECLRLRKTRLTEFLFSLGNHISHDLMVELEALSGPVHTYQKVQSDLIPSTNLLTRASAPPLLRGRGIEEVPEIKKSVHSGKFRSKSPPETKKELFPIYVAEGAAALSEEIVKARHGDDHDSFALIMAMRQRIIDLKRIPIDVTRTQITEKLAETGGSSASVYGCIVDGWQCAMKELDLQGVSRRAIKGFETEISLLESLPFHHNIIRYLFHQKKGNSVRLFMTRYTTSLGKVILQREKNLHTKGAKGFTPREITRWSIEIATGLEYLKFHRILHRDLKSDNIFVTLDSSGAIQRLIIGDFDTAKRVSKKEGLLPKTTIGTPAYMAPEVINPLPHGSYSFQADVWSFGMVLFEMMSLKPPYSNLDNLFDVPQLILAGIRPSPCRVLPPEYDPLYSIFISCTNYNGDQRPEISTVLQELQSLQKHYEDT